MSFMHCLSPCYQVLWHLYSLLKLDHQNFLPSLSYLWWSSRCDQCGWSLMVALTRSLWNHYQFTCPHSSFSFLWSSLPPLDSKITYFPQGYHYTLTPPLISQLITECINIYLIKFISDDTLFTFLLKDQKGHSVM